MKRCMEVISHGSVTNICILRWLLYFMNRVKIMRSCNENSSYDELFFFAI